MFNMLFFDIDGTLISPDHFPLSPRNRRALAGDIKKTKGYCLTITDPLFYHN